MNRLHVLCVCVRRCFREAYVSFLRERKQKERKEVDVAAAEDTERRSRKQPLCNRHTKQEHQQQDKQSTIGLAHLRRGGGAEGCRCLSPPTPCSPSRSPRARTVPFRCLHRARTTTTARMHAYTQALLISRKRTPSQSIGKLGPASVFLSSPFPTLPTLPRTPHPTAGHPTQDTPAFRAGPAPWPSH